MSPTMHERLSHERRRLILEALQQDSGYRMNEASMKAVLEHLGHTVGADQVRAELGYLERHQLVRVDTIASGDRDLRVAVLTEAGQDVARGVAHEGVARRRA